MMAAPMRTDWRRLAVSLAASVSLLVAAMMLYPGGDKFDADSVGYRFWHTFICDLLEAETPGAHQNEVGAILTVAAMAILTIGGLLQLWWDPPGPPATAAALKVSRISGVACCLFTLLVCVEVALRLSISHELITLLAGASGLLASIAPFVGVLRSPSAPVLVKVTGLAVIVAVLVNLAYYGQIAWAGEPLPPELAATQKCALLLIVIWLAQLAMALRGGDLSGGPSRPGAPSTPDRWSTIKSAKPRAEPPTRPGD